MRKWGVGQTNLGWRSNEPTGNCSFSDLELSSRRWFQFLSKLKIYFLKNLDGFLDARPGRYLATKMQKSILKEISKLKNNFLPINRGNIIIKIPFKILIYSFFFFSFENQPWGSKLSAVGGQNREQLGVQI